MAAHLLRYPAGGLYSSTITLNPALIIIQEDEDVQPVQRVVRAADKTRWAFQLSTNRLRTFRMIAERWHESDSGANSGYTSFRTFVENVANYSMVPFDLTHADGATTKVCFVLGSLRFTEVQYFFWSGEALMESFF